MKNTYANTTVLDLLFNAANRNPSKTYCKSANHEFNYQQFVAACIKLSKEISDKNIKNQIIGIFLPNSILFLISYFAILISGNRPALLNHLLPDLALSKMIDNLEPSLLISDKQLLKSRSIIVKIEDYLELKVSSIDEADFICEGMEVGAILFSGGTTGIPKQINHSHKCIISMVDRMEWGWPTTPNEKWLVVAPFTHIYGFLTGVTNPLLKSGTVFIPDAFDPKLIVEKLNSEEITVFG